METNCKLANPPPTGNRNAQPSATDSMTQRSSRESARSSTCEIQAWRPPKARIGGSAPEGPLESGRVSTIQAASLAASAPPGGRQRPSASRWTRSSTSSRNPRCGQDVDIGCRPPGNGALPDGMRASQQHGIVPERGQKSRGRCAEQDMPAPRRRTQFKPHVPSLDAEKPRAGQCCDARPTHDRRSIGPPSFNTLRLKRGARHMSERSASPPARESRRCPILSTEQERQRLSCARCPVCPSQTWET